MPAADSSEVERFRSIIARRLGLELEDDKLVLLGDVLARRAARAKTKDTAPT
jgi:hypothetical protein